MYAMTPETYTTFTATGAPNLAAAPSPSGVGHEKLHKAAVDDLGSIASKISKDRKGPRT